MFLRLLPLGTFVQLGGKTFFVEKQLLLLGKLVQLEGKYTLNFKDADCRIGEGMFFWDVCAARHGTRHVTPQLMRFSLWYHNMFFVVDQRGRCHPCRGREELSRCLPQQRPHVTIRKYFEEKYTYSIVQIYILFIIKLDRPRVAAPGQIGAAGGQI